MATILGFIVLSLFGVTFVAIVWGIQKTKSMKERAHNRFKNIFSPDNPTINDPGSLNAWLEKDKRKKTLMEDLAKATNEFSQKSGKAIANA